MKRWVAVGLLAFSAQLAAAPTTLQEGFDNLAASGWLIQNASSPVGVTSWFQGNAAVFSSQSGAPNSYAAANFLSTSPIGGTISTWLISPEIQFASQTLSFFTRTEAGLGAIFGDGLRVLVSTSGASTSRSDFSTLFEINGTNVAGAYPEAWTQYSLLLGSLGSGRIAFEYSVNANALANYIGLDTVSIFIPEPAMLALLGLAIVAAGLGIRRTRRSASALAVAAVTAMVVVPSADAQLTSPSDPGVLSLPNVRINQRPTRDAKLSLPAETVTAFIDRDSGQLMQPSFDELGDLERAAGHRKPEGKARNASIRLANGAYRMAASPSMINLSTARIAEDGRVMQACTPYDGYAARMLFAEAEVQQ